MSKTTLSGALIGEGNVTSFHLQAWQRIPQTVVAITDPDMERARTRAREFGIAPGRVFASSSDLLQAEAGLDFVDIGTPRHLHGEQTKLAAACGLHVLCQKPFAANLAEVRATIGVCQCADVVLNINENWRWRPCHRTIKQMVSQGEIGCPAYVRVFSHGSS